MKRVISLALALAMVLALASCQKTPAKPTASPKAEVTKTAQEVLDTLKKELGDSYTCDQAETKDRMSDFYGLDMSKIDSWAAEGSSNSSMKMDAAIVLKVKDGYAKDAAALLQKAFDQTASYAQMYSMDLYRTSQARIFISGNYVAYFILGKNGGVDATEEALAKLATEEAAKIDAAWEGIFGTKPENLAVMPKSNGNSFYGDGGNTQDGGYVKVG